MRILSFFLAILLATLQRDINAEEKRILKIGVVAPLSGELALFGSKMMEGVELAKEKLKDEPVQFFIEDSGEVTKPTIVAATQKLISVHHIDLLIGLTFEDQLSKIYPILKRNNIPVFGAALCSEITLDFPNAACSYPSAREQLIPMFPDAKKRGIKTFSFIGEESAFAQGTLKEFSKLTKENDFKLSSVSTIPQNSLDFKSIISRALISKPDAMIVATTDPAKSLAMLRQIKEQGYKGIRYGFIDYDKKYYSEFGDSVKGVILPGWISSNFNPHFVAAYQKKWPAKTGDIDVYTVIPYDMIMYSVQSARALNKQNTPLAMAALIRYEYAEPAIPGFHYRADRSVSMPIVVKAITGDGSLSETLP